MEYAVIDIEGATLGVFEDASSTRTFLRRSARSDGYELQELGVLAYGEGTRTGEPRPATEFLLPATRISLAATQAEPLTVPAGQNLVLALRRLPTQSRSRLDALILSKLPRSDLRREALA